MSIYSMLYVVLITLKDINKGIHGQSQVENLEQLFIWYQISHSKVTILFFAWESTVSFGLSPTEGALL